MNPFRLIVLLEVLAYTTLYSNAGSIKVCGTDLLDAVKSVCGLRGFYSPPDGLTQEPGDGIVTRCCDKRCDMSVLEQYCAPATPEPPLAPIRTTASRGDGRRTDKVTAPTAGGGSGAESGRTGGGSQAARAGAAGGGGDRGTPESSPAAKNKTKPRPTEIGGKAKPAREEEEAEEEEEEEAGEESRGGNGGERKDNRSPSARPERLTDAGGTPGASSRERATNRPNRSREGGRNKGGRVNDSHSRRRNSSDRRRNGDRRTPSSKRASKQRRKDQQKNPKRQSNGRRRSRPDRRVAAGDKTATTPSAVQTAQNPLKNAGYNSTSGELSLVNVTDTASASETKKDGFFTTITAVLRDVIGYKPADDKNR